MSQTMKNQNKNQNPIISSRPYCRWLVSFLLHRCTIMHKRPFTRRARGSYLWPSNGRRIFRVSPNWPSVIRYASATQKQMESLLKSSFRSQVILLEESWAELFLLNAIQWCMPLDPSNCALFSVTEHCSNITATGISKQELALDIRTLHDTLCRFKSILVDPAEFACLKAIVLFRSETRGLKDPSPIENLQDQAQVCVCLKKVFFFELSLTHFYSLLCRWCCRNIVAGNFQRQMRDSADCCWCCRYCEPSIHIALNPFISNGPSAIRRWRKFFVICIKINLRIEIHQSPYWMPALQF